jgi:cytochrome c biogenesis protein CcmG, thiol:disulfide interchange protein DsbE
MFLALRSGLNDSCRASSPGRDTGSRAGSPGRDTGSLTRRPPRPKRAIAICFWLLLPAAACTPDAGGFRPLAAGDAAPEFGAPVLDGDSLHLSSLRGQPVLLNVWATWCPPCREEMPALQALHEEYGPRGLRVLGVSVDSRGSEETIRSFLREGGYSFTILHDAADAVSRQFRTIGVPETFLIDGDGRVVRRWIGKFDPLAEDVVADIEPLLPRHEIPRADISAP